MVKTLPRRRTLSEWTSLGKRDLQKVLTQVKEAKALRKLNSAPLDNWTVDVLFVGRQRMQKLNHEYRKKNYATDVLSFTSSEPFFSQGYLGELVLCGPVLEAQAREFSHSPETELKVLLIHGVLHLLGFDHERGEKEAQTMAKWEDFILSRVISSRDAIKGLPLQRTGKKSRGGLENSLKNCQGLLRRHNLGK